MDDPTSTDPTVSRRAFLAGAVALAAGCGVGEERPAAGAPARIHRALPRRPAPLRGLGPLLGQPLGPGLRPIRRGDRVEVLLLGQDDASDNGPWIAREGDWTRPARGRA